jgi:hypothetical protein
MRTSSHPRRNEWIPGNLFCWREQLWGITHFQTLEHLHCISQSSPAPARSSATAFSKLQAGLAPSPTASRHGLATPSRTRFLSTEKGTFARGNPRCYHRSGEDGRSVDLSEDVGLVAPWGAGPAFCRLFWSIKLSSCFCKGLVFLTEVLRDGLVCLVHQVKLLIRHVQSTHKTWAVERYVATLFSRTCGRQLCLPLIVTNSTEQY